MTPCEKQSSKSNIMKYGSFDNDCNENLFVRVWKIETFLMYEFESETHFEGPFRDEPGFIGRIFRLLIRIFASFSSADDAFKG